MNEQQKPNCYECQYRRRCVGSAHSRCVHPALPKEGDNPLEEVMAIFASVGRTAPMIHAAALELGIRASEHGIRNNWFLWPWSFDPIWLLACNGFEKKGE